MGLFTSALIAPLVLLGGIPVFIYLYAILRWRAGGAHEPGLGSYSLVLFFRTIALLLSTGAVSLLVYLLLAKDENDQMMRACWAVLLSSVVFLAVQVYIGGLLRPAGGCIPATRLFGGGLMGIAGAIVFGALVVLFVTLLEKMPDDPESVRFERRNDTLKMVGSWLFCFGVLYGCSAKAMSKAIREAGTVRH